MLTRQQLQRIAQREHIGLQAQERDYIQHLLLAQLYNRNQSLVFKGGTLGHESLDIVRCYAELADSDLEEARKIASPMDNWNFWDAIISVL